MWSLAAGEMDAGYAKATEIAFWRRSAGIFLGHWVGNDRVHQIMKVESDIVRTKQLVKCSHVSRMTEERLPEKMLDWILPRRIRRERPVKGWQEEALNEGGVLTPWRTVEEQDTLAVRWPSMLDSAVKAA